MVWTEKEVQLEFLEDRDRKAHRVHEVSYPSYNFCNVVNNVQFAKQGRLDHPEPLVIQVSKL